MWTRLFLLILLSLKVSSALSEVESSCMVCHSTKASERTCVSCHTSPLKPRLGRSVTNLYGNAPRFEEQNLKELEPFDPEGLSEYLKNPPIRRRHYAGMFVLNESQAFETVKSTREWQNPTIFKAQKELEKRGREIFQEKGCTGCHSDKGDAPLLPIGYPLYNFQYISKILKGQNVYYKDPAVSRTMPVYKDLSDDDMKALFSYLSLSRHRSIEELEDEVVLTHPDNRIYQATVKVFQQNGCLHCHGARDVKNTETKSIFGGQPELFKLNQVNGQLEVYPSRSLFKKDEKGKNRLVRALEARRKEWGGVPDLAVRGMPLTLPPLKNKDLRIVKEWVRADCPTPKEKLCS